MVERFAMAKLRGAQRLAQLRLGETPHRVLWCLISHLRKGALVYVTQAQMAEELGISSSNFSTAVRQLLDADVVRWVVDDDGRRAMAISAEFFAMPYEMRSSLRPGNGRKGPRFARAAAAPVEEVAA